MERYKVVEASLLPPDFPATWPEPLVEVVKAADAQVTIAALQARVDNLEHQIAQRGGLAAIDDFRAKAGLYDQLAQSLTQRTAELEAANKLLYRKNCALGRAETIINDLQAELERVRGELVETKEVEAALSSKVAEYEVELNGDPQNFYGGGRTVGLRTLIAALPKVEGAVVVSHGYVKDSTRCHALFGADEDAALYAALLKHRQGMEG